MAEHAAGEVGQAASPANSAATDDAPLRQRLIDLLWADPASAEALPLQAFLDETDPGRGLVQWFGRRADGTGRAQLLAALDRDIARLDELLSLQLDAILHAQRLQRLEASWRGLAYLLGRADGMANIKVKVLDLRWVELCRDLGRAPDFDRSQVFQKVYETEFGMPGGEPFGVLLGDYAVRHRPGAGHSTDDVAALTAMSHVAAAAFCPFLVTADPALFGMDSFDDLSAATNMVAPFRQAEYERWKSFQATEDARFVSVLMPQVLMRPPYGDDPARADGFRYRETANTAEHHLWGSPVFAFGTVVLRAYVGYRWNADIRGVQGDAESGGLVADLPILSFATDRPGIATKYATAAYLTERQENELCEHGFLPLMNCQYTPHSAFFGNASVQRAQAYDGQAATINARMSAMLQYMLCVSRFAHYIKVMARDWTGSFASAEDCQRKLSQWLQGFCASTDEVSFETKARYPLREAKVSVREVSGSPGLYFATIQLKPHFQLDQIVSSFKLTTTLPGKTAA